MTMKRRSISVARPSRENSMATTNPSTAPKLVRGLSALKQGRNLKHGHNVHVDSNPGLFPGFPNLSFNFFSDKPEHVDLEGAEEHNDRYNYALLIALYTLQGIPMGLSASIPFLIQQKVKQMAMTTAASAATGAVDAVSSAAAVHAPSVAKMAYNAQAIFALCSWPFSLKLLWAPVVDSVFWKRFGRRKSWLVPVQALAGLIMVTGSDYVEQQLGFSSLVKDTVASFDVKGITAFFFALYFLMATQDIAVDGWALTMLSKKNRPKGPVCNSIGQNLGYFLSFVGFLALNDPESSEKLWRPLFGLKSKPGAGLVSLGGFVKFMGLFMLAVTSLVAIFKREVDNSTGAVVATTNRTTFFFSEEDEEAELDASKIGLAETYHRLYAVCQLPAVRWLFLILLTYRLPTALSDNVKFLKAVEFGLSKQTTALLSPMIVLPLGIAVPIVAAKLWKGHPLKQFMRAYEIRVSLVPLIDMAMLLAVRSLRTNHDPGSQTIFWSTLIISTALQAMIQSLQFNAQMTFFASRVDPAIGGSYMTLLNTAANLGGTWPASVVMYLVGSLTVPPTCASTDGGVEVCTGGKDAYFPLQIAFSILGFLWVFLFSSKVKHISELPEDAWRTHLDETKSDSSEMEGGGTKSTLNNDRKKAK